MEEIIEFLSAVTPFGGNKCVGALNQGAFKNYFGRDAAWAARAAEKIDLKEVDAYFALAGFGDAKKRTQDNVEALRAFWLDLDVGEGPHKYPNQKSAASALVTLVKELGLPKPWIVNSGNGVHVYWPCDEDIAPDSWKQTATLLKRTCKTWGLHADPSRTTDSASVLRPVGTRNHKDPVNPKPVKLLTRGGVTSQAKLHFHLEKYLKANDALPVERFDNINSDLTNRGEFLPSNADRIAEKCAVMREVRDTRGQVEEPLWHSALGVLIHTVEGETACYTWSDGHPHYSKSETDAKIARARGFGPTTCERFSDFRPAECAACPFNGKLRSPITLGTMATPEPVPEEAKLPAEKRPLGVDAPEGFPATFGWSNAPSGGKGGSVLWRARSTNVEDDEGNSVERTEYDILSDVLFLPTARVQEKLGDDAINSMSCAVHKEDGQVTEFNIDNGIVNNPAALSEALARREIVVSKNLASVYLNAWIAKLRKETPTTPLVKQFGWSEDGFVIGPDILAPSGQHKAMLTDSAAQFGVHLHTAGELKPWVDTVNKIYNHPGQEALQFSILSAFAAPLWSLFGDNGGVVVYAHSAKSGYGKSTAQQVGLSAWGYYPQLLLTAGNFTVNALYQHIGLMNHLPTVIDEMTKSTREFASALVYDISTGKGKSRLTADAALKQTLNWSTVVSASGNTLLTEKLAMNRAQAEAEMFRVWEFTITQRGQLDPNAALRLFDVFKHNYGHAGREFAKYVVENRDKVRKQLLATREWFNTEMQVTQAERFWSQLHACILTALAICRKLGVLGFDQTALVAWIKQELDSNRDQITESSSDPLDQFANMLSDIAPGILVTRGEGHLTNGVPAEVIRDPGSKSIVGRSIRPSISEKNTSEKLWISVAIVRRWCDQNGSSFKDMHEALVGARWVDPNIRRVVLGKGTEAYAGLGGSVKCWDVNASLIRGTAGSNPSAQRVCGVIRGGLDDASGVA